MKNITRSQQIEKELRAVGVTSYGLMKAEARELPRLLAVDEKVHGCIYGQYSGGSAMMVATDRRIIFLDKKPLHLMLEEMTYDRILDIGADWQPLFCKVVINARSEKYVFRYVNSRCARIFVRFLETAVLGMPDPESYRGSKARHYAMRPLKQFTADETPFVRNHYFCVVSTVGPGATPYGSAMFYFPDEDGFTIRIVTRSETQTAQNLRRHNKVALTISDETMLATMHIGGVAELEDDTEEGYAIVSHLLRDKPHLPQDVLPPVAQMKNGAYVVFKITCSSSHLRTYKTTA